MVDKAARYIPITLNKNHNDSRTKKVVNAHENCRSRIKTFKIVISKIDQGKSKNGTSAQGSPFSLLHDYATKLSVLNMLHMIVSLQHINNYTVILYNATFVLKLSPKGDVAVVCGRPADCSSVLFSKQGRVPNAEKTPSFAVPCSLLVK